MRDLIVVSNRGPAVIDRNDAGDRVIRRGAGGLVTALRPLVARHAVTWIASAMTDEERAVAGEGPVDLDLAGGQVRLRLVAHDARDYELFYSVFANPVLWFVQHDLWQLMRDPQRDLSDAWRAYRAVNDSFARAVAQELDRTPTADVLFQDYHLYLAPRLVRRARPDARLAHFLHVPWVTAAGWSVLPNEIVRAVHDGLLANDVIGFHTERWRAAFLESCRAYLDAGAADDVLAVATPISVDAAEFDRLQDDEAVRERRARIVGSRPERLILRVDRTDPSKNAVRGFDAFARLLDRRPDLRGRVGMLALLAPSRLEIPEYRDYLEDVQAAARGVNEAFGAAGWSPVELDVRDDFPSTVAAYAEYDVLLANPVMDGLNLVAKEAPLLNRREGAIVLSRDAGAWEELAPYAIGVDPLDVDQQARALERALELPAAERAARHSALTREVRAHGIDEWANAQLEALDRATTMRR